MKHFSASAKMASTMDAEASKNPCKSDKQTLLAVLQFLQKHNLKETENLLKREARVTDEDLKTEEDKKSNVSQALSVYKSEGDPSLYDDLYQDLKTFIDSCLDIHKVELSTVLYPVFVHMYLELIYNSHEWNASEFYSKFSRDQDENYHKDMSSLSSVRKKEHMDGNQLMDTFKSSRFTLKMSRDSYNHLKRHLQEKRLAPLLTIIQDHLFIEVFDGVPRTQTQIDTSSGGLLGEVDKDANKVKVLYGLLREPDLNIPLEEEEDGMDAEEKPRKKKMKKDPLLIKKSKTDPNAPNATRIPLPEMKDQDKAEKILAYREALKRIKIDHNHLPSICFYTFLNSFHGVTCVDFSEDSSLLAAGFSDGNIRVWALTQRKLRAMKTPDSLEIIDKEADDVLERIYDDRTASDCKLLVGHSSTVYSTSISHDRLYMISCSEDGSIRLWSFLTWTNLVCYKGHNFPVWDVKFGPHSYYFVSAGHDRTARMWATDHPQALRIFAGHLTDVDCCQFHPNSNYVATGSSDKSVRLWDVLSGNCTRTFIGHKQTIHCLQFSPGGKHLASGGADRLIFVWDIATGTAVASLKGHVDTIYTLCFARDGSLLASGGLDDSIRLWDMQKVVSEQDTEADTTVPSNINVNTNPNLLLGTYRTKGTSVLGLHFTRRNLLLGAGSYRQPTSS